MTIKRPNIDELRKIAKSLSLNLSDNDLEFFLENMKGALDSYDIVDQLPDYLPDVKYERSPGVRPSQDENPLNAWYVKTNIIGAKRGKLFGKTVAIKDNIAVAGVQMMNGASALEGYMPEIDATVVTRLLDAGAIIKGKAQCEYYCLSGGSHTSAQGYVRNPNNKAHSTAGSSSGCAALVANGDVDLAIGGDQGGSIRTPSSYCGIVGLKPTWGLVPYTGAMPIELTIDHLGPMTRTVEDNALMLEVIAGTDGLDPRQDSKAKAQRYTKALGRDCKGLKIGVLKEGFGHHNSEADVEDSVRNAAEQFKKLGAQVQEVSVPMHKVGPDIWLVLAFEGATEQLMKGNSHGFNWKGLYLPSMIEAHAAWRQKSHLLSDTVKSTVLTGEYMIQSGRGKHYAKAQNLTRQLKAEYDKVLIDFDILLMPTTPLKAPPLPPEKNAPRELIMQRATENMANTFPFDLTSHPALQLPCGISEGLPIGMMLVGRHFDEMTLYRAGHAFEQSGNWKNRKA